LPVRAGGSQPASGSRSAHVELPATATDSEDNTGTPETELPAPASATDADQIEALSLGRRTPAPPPSATGPARVRSDLAVLKYKRLTRAVDTILAATGPSARRGASPAIAAA
jgi:hypothetical protein